MSCIIKLNESGRAFKFYSEGCKQQILINMLLQYSEWHLASLSESIGVPVVALQEVQSGKTFLEGEAADNLAQLFLFFFGRIFHSKFTVTRNYT